jgi:hypothetical protein
VGRAHAARLHLQHQCVSLFTQHPTRVNALPTDLRPEVEHLGKETVYLKDLPEAFNVSSGTTPRFLSIKAIDDFRVDAALWPTRLQSSQLPRHHCA